MFYHNVMNFKLNLKTNRSSNQNMTPSTQKPVLEIGDDAINTNNSKTSGGTLYILHPNASLHNRLHLQVLAKLSKPTKK